MPGKCSQANFQFGNEPWDEIQEYLWYTTRKQLGSSLFHARFSREITESRGTNKRGAFWREVLHPRREKLWRETIATTNSCDGRGSLDYGGKRTGANCGGKTPLHTTSGIRWIWNSFLAFWLAESFVTCDNKWHLYVISPTVIVILKTTLCKTIETKLCPPSTLFVLWRFFFRKKSITVSLKRVFIGK